MRRTRPTLGLVMAMVCCAMSWTPAVRADDGGVEVLKQIQDHIEQVAEDVGKSVVSITVSSRVQPGAPQFQGIPFEDLPPEFRWFLNPPDNQDRNQERNPGRTPPRRRRSQPQQPEGGQLVPRGIGSGIILSADGYIVTNQHVVDQADEVTVTLSDRRQFKAKIVGEDPRRDLAVVKIDAEGLPAAAFDHTTAIKRGMFVLAIGCPFGFGAGGEASVSFGIISGTRRNLALGMEEDRYYGKLIQTDAAINPGNSGGALCDLDGKVIGINVAIASQSGGSQGVAFAIPVDDLTLSIIDRLKRGENIAYGYLGVGVRTPTTEESETAGAPMNTGAFVMSVEPDSPAEKAGVQPADLITDLDGKPLKDADDLVTDIGRTSPGDKVALTIYRSGKKISVDATVASRPGTRVAGGGRPSPRHPAGSGFQWRGMTLSDLTGTIRSELGLDESVQGVYVQDVEADSPAAAAGIAAGSVIDQVGSKKLENLDELKKAVEKLEGKVFVNVVGAGPVIVGK